MKSVLKFVERNPGKSASIIAQSVGLHLPSVSSFLAKEVKAGRLVRRLGKGPRGGFGYYPTNAPESPKSLTVWDHILGEETDSRSVLTLRIQPRKGRTSYSVEGEDRSVTVHNPPTLSRERVAAVLYLLTELNWKEIQNRFSSVVVVERGDPDRIEAVFDTRVSPPI